MEIGSWGPSFKKTKNTRDGPVSRLSVALSVIYLGESLFYLARQRDKILEEGALQCLVPALELNEGASLLSEGPLVVTCFNFRTV